jgi:hypothetical protein
MGASTAMQRAAVTPGRTERAGVSPSRMPPELVARGGEGGMGMAGPEPAAEKEAGRVDTDTGSGFVEVGGHEGSLPAAA